MHINHNTNQTTLPLELSCCLPQNHVVFTIEQVVNELKDDHFQAFYHNFCECNLVIRNSLETTEGLKYGQE